MREPFPWFASGRGDGQTRWFAPRYDKPDDGVSREEQAKSGGMLDLVRGLTNLRTRHPGVASGELGAILSDSADWLVFERVRGGELLFWSDGRDRRWKDTTADQQRIADSVFVPPAGLVVIRQRS